MSEMRADLEKLIARIDAQLVELDDLAGFPIPHKRHPPASAERIASLEQALGSSLPEDYRTFLMIHDGWEGFNGDSRLLSTSELKGGPLHDHLKAFQDELRQDGHLNPAEGLVFEGSFGTRMSYFDRASQRAGGALEVVFWDIGEIERYPSFTEYLAGFSKTLDQLIEDERRNLR